MRGSAGMAGRNMESLEGREPVLAYGDEIHGAACVDKGKLQSPACISPPRRSTNIGEHPRSVAACHQIIRIGCGGRVFARTMAREEVNVRQVTPPAGIHVLAGPVRETAFPPIVF